jgi:hypothetical protein
LELQNQLTGAEWFSKLDLQEAYYRIRIKEGEKWKTAFRTKYGQYKYVVLPMGLTNAPATFQRMISGVLEKFRDRTAMVFFDNILVYIKERWEKHLEQVREVLEELETHDFKLNKKKSIIGVKKVEFLKAIIGQGWIKMDSTKVEVIREWPVPTKIKEVQAFLELTNYYWKFVKDYARITTPLTTLLKKENRFK